VENYVKFACDHIRSILKGAVRKLKVEDFYASSTDYIRDILLGKATAEAKRAGMKFEENGMRMVDVEVLKVALLDDQIRNMLDQSQKEVVRTNIEMSTLQRNLDLLQQRELISRQEMQTRAETKKLSDATSIDLLASQLSVKLSELANKLRELDASKQAQNAQEELQSIAHAAGLDRKAQAAHLEAQLEEDRQQRQIALLVAETKSVAERFAALQGGFAEALVALSNKDTMVKVAEAWSIQRVIGGDNVSDSINKVFRDTPLEGLVKKIVAVAANGHTTPPVAPTAS
jgi:hypothetical protein